MSTEKNKRARKVGIFITAGIAILIVGVFTLGGQQKAFVKSETISAVFEDVSGLQKGNNVWFSGVKIGTVRRIAFEGTSSVKVTMQIEEKAIPFIRKDSKAKIGSEGLIGNKIIVIYGGTPGAGQVEKDDNIAVEKYLSTDDIMATLQVNNQNLAAITTDFKEISKRLVAGEGTVGSLLKDESLYKNLQSTMANLKVAAGNSEKLTEGIADYTARLRSPGSLASGLVDDTVIMSNLRTAVRQLHNVASSANVITENLKATTNDLNNNNNAVGVFLRDEQVATDLKSAIKNLNSSSIKLDEDLEALQHNFLLRGFFRRKAKQEQKEREKKVE
ncbi:MAG: MCE family protein [Chitinophagaceae bacterium]|nr:MCE family protein [Chitinophagaceae bacterium]